MERPRIFLLININNGYSRGLLTSITRAAMEKRFIFDLHEGDAETGLAKLAVADGVIGQLYTPTVLSAICELNKPTVNLSNAVQEDTLPRICNDDLVIGTMAAEYFLGKGFRQFLMVRGDMHYACLREEGFVARLAKEGLTPEIVVETELRSFELPAAMRWLSDWKESGRRPLAIFTDRDRMALPLLQICRELEIRVPEDMAILGVDNDTTLCELCQPRLSSIQQNYDRIGQEAVQLMERLLAGHAPPKKPIQVPPTGVVTRESTDILAIDDAEVADTLHFIHEHADQVINTKDLFALVGVSRRTLDRKFMQAIGRTPVEEIVRVHLERARWLLTTTNLSLGEIACRSGFPDARRLFVVFRRELKTTPTAYRRTAMGMDNPPH